MTYRSDGKLLIHFVNGIGQRPLASAIPYYNLAFSVKIPEGVKVKSVTSRIAGEKILCHTEGNWLFCELDKLNTWDMLVIEWEI